MAILRTEDVIVARGGSVLDVRGNDFDTALLVGGRIWAYQWCDCQGSIGQHLIRATSSDPASAIVNFRRSVASAVPDDVSLALHFGEVIVLLVDGKYRLQLEDLPSDTCVVELEARQGSSFEHTNYYAGFRSLVATQPGTSLSTSTVREHLGAIRTGARPAVVTLAAGDAVSEFILDGHHKLKAYREAAVPIRNLAIYRLDSAQVDITDALTFLPESSGLRDHLRKHKH